MKRNIEAVSPGSAERSSKKAKSDGTISIFDDQSLEKQWTDIESSLATDNGNTPGWIEGNVFMVWPYAKKRDVQLMLKDGSQLKISISCPECQLFQFTPGQKIKLSLKGAEVSRKAQSTSAIRHIPFQLTFRDGSSVKFIEGRALVEDGLIVDVWEERAKVESERESKQADWFSTPCPSALGPLQAGSSDREHSLLELRMEEPKSNNQRKALSSSPMTSPPPQTPDHNEKDTSDSVIAVSQEKNTNSPYGSSPVEDAAKDQESIDITSSHPSSHPSLQGEKKKKKRDTRHDPFGGRKKSASASGVESENAASENDGVVNDGMTSAEPLKARVKLSRAEKRRRERKFMAACKERPRTPSPPRRNPALDMVAGLASENGVFPALADIQVYQMTQVIGIVADIEAPKVTRTKDICISMTLVDPSKYLNGWGFKVTCFMKDKYKNLLPNVRKDHVILLQNVKCSSWRGNINGTVYPDKLKWVAFNPSDGKFYFNEATDSGTSDFAADTFHQPKDKEIVYFVDLGEWWRAVKEEEGNGAIEIQGYSRKVREHRLIGDMDTDIFFNATIEIVHRSADPEFDQVYLLLSDYTPHRLRSTSGVFGQWAVGASTAKLEREILDQMVVGSFWNMKNIRLKVGSDGSLECDLWGADVMELLPDEADDDLHLQTLLKRKSEYEVNHPKGPDGKGTHGGAISLVSDISGPGYLCLVAELLYRSSPDDKVTDLFVSDYTDNSLVSSSKPPTFKRMWNGQPVFRIGVWGERDIVREMEYGSIYQFTDINIQTDYDGGFKGKLYRANDNIKKVSIRRGGDNDVLQALLKRKAAFLNMATTVNKSEVPPPCVPEVPIPENMHKTTNSTEHILRTHHANQPKATIKQIRANEKYPNKFRLVARIVDFAPLNIKDFTRRRCHSCKVLIPETRHACIACDDMTGEQVEWIYNMFFRLEDEDGERLSVSVCDEGKQFLGGLEPRDLTNETHLKELMNRLQICLGNLIEVHEGLKENKVITCTYGPYLDLGIKSWQILDEEKKFTVYALTGCELISHLM